MQQHVERMKNDPKVQNALLNQAIRNDRRTTRKPTSRIELGYQEEMQTARIWDREMSRLLAMHAANPFNDADEREICSTIEKRLLYANTHFAKFTCTHGLPTERCVLCVRAFVAQDHQLSCVSAHREAATHADRVGASVASEIELGGKAFTLVATHADDADATITQNELLALRKLGVARGVDTWILPDSTVVAVVVIEASDELNLIGITCNSIRTQPLSDTTQLRRFYRQYPECLKRLTVQRCMTVFLERKRRARAKTKGTSVNQAARNGMAAHAEILAALAPELKPRKTRTPNIRMRRSNGIFRQRGLRMAIASTCIEHTSPELKQAVATQVALAQALESTFTREDAISLESWTRNHELNVMQLGAVALQEGRTGTANRTAILLGVLRGQRAKAHKRSKHAMGARTPADNHIVPLPAFANHTCKTHNAPVVFLGIVNIGRDATNVAALNAL